VPDNVVVQVHGSFETASCSNLDCVAHEDHQPGEAVLDDIIKSALFCFLNILCFYSGSTPTCAKCGKPMKPDVIFFGEPIPAKV
jgi:NAD-dependent SIR2 family protein deacetylase